MSKIILEDDFGDIVSFEYFESVKTIRLVMLADDYKEEDLCIFISDRDDLIGIRDIINEAIGDE